MTSFVSPAIAGSIGADPIFSSQFTNLRTLEREEDLPLLWMGVLVLHVAGGTLCPQTAISKIRPILNEIPLQHRDGVDLGIAPHLECPYGIKLCARGTSGLSSALTDQRSAVLSHPTILSLNLGDAFQMLASQASGNDLPDWLRYRRDNDAWGTLLQRANEPLRETTPTPRFGQAMFSFLRFRRP